MSYITEYTTDIRHVDGPLNVVADLVSRLEINIVLHFQNDVDYKAMAIEQQADTEVKQLVSDRSDSSLVLEQFCVSDNSPLLWCDTSMSFACPIVPDKFRRTVFEKIHSLSHTKINTTICLIVRRFVWPGVKKQVTTWVKECLTCQK